MIKILTPNDIILNEVSRNETVSAFIKEINSFLEQEDTKYSYSCVVPTSEPLETKEIYLIERAFKLFGWQISISSNFNKDIVNNNVLLTPLK